MLEDIGQKQILALYVIINSKVVEPFLMGRGSTQDQVIEFLHSKRGVREKDIGWVLSKLDSQEYILEDCHFLARIRSKEFEKRLRRFLSIVMLL